MGRTLQRTRISGTGSYFPEKLLTNKDLEKMVETDDQWIRERTGIASRHIAADGQFTSDLGYEASLKALEMAELSPEDIDMIIFATVSPDQPMPNTACVLQKKLGCRNVVAFDLSAACTGFVYSLSVANKFIQTGTYKHILVVGAEVLHNYVNYKDRETCILFGDGAGAAVVSRAEEGQDSEILSEHLYADGQISDLFVLPAGGSKMPFTQEVLDSGNQYMNMRGREIFKHAVRTMSQSCSEALETNNLTKDDIDWIIPHQANLRILDAVAKHFDFPNDKVIVNLQHTGNTSAATVPTALDEAVRDGRIQRGQMLLLTAFGAGITSGSICMRF